MQFLKYIKLVSIVIMSMFYIGVGIVTVLNGGEFLNYNLLSEHPITGQHIGIILIELGVGITVASTMIILFYAFARP